MFSDDAAVDRVLRGVGFHAGGWAGDPRLLAADARAARRVAVRRADGDLPGRAQAGAARAVRGGRGRRRRARGGKFWSVTLPMLSPVIFFNLLLETINAFQVVHRRYVVGGRNGLGGPPASTLFYTSTCSNAASGTTAWDTRRRWRGCCLLGVGLVTAFLFRTARSWVFYSDGSNHEAMSTRVRRVVWHAAVLALLLVVLLYPMVWVDRRPSFKPSGGHRRQPRAVPGRADGRELRPGRRGHRRRRASGRSSSIPLVLAGCRCSAPWRRRRWRRYAFARLRFRGRGAHVRHHDLDAAAAVPRADHPAVHGVQPARTHRHLRAAADRQVPRRRGVLRVPHRAVHPHRAERARRVREDRRLRAVAACSGTSSSR